MPIKVKTVKGKTYTIHCDPEANPFFFPASCCSLHGGPQMHYKPCHCVSKSSPHHAPLSGSQEMGYKLPLHIGPETAAVVGQRILFQGSLPFLHPSKLVSPHNVYPTCCYVAAGSFSLSGCLAPSHNTHTLTNTLTLS